MKILRISCVFGGFLFLVLSLPAQTFTSLHSFDGSDGAFPMAPLVQATNGKLYGTTSVGGDNANSFCSSGGCGTILEITAGGKLTTLYNFNFGCGYSGCGGNFYPYAGLIQATDGNFYGTTSQGGDNCITGYYGCGTIFKITPSGTLTTLYNFTGDGDGGDPVASLIQATNGNFYGTTYGGGDGYGTIFTITPSGTLTTLYSFGCSQIGGCRDGVYPAAGLIQAADGNFYGTTSGGTADGNKVGETVFKITPSGTLTTLYSFTGGSDGGAPMAGLIQATDGNFYGTSSEGGANGGGTVFKITPSGALTTLYSFCSQNFCTDGQDPAAALVQNTNGNFYGTTVYGGSADSCLDGNAKVACGTVFSLSVGLHPFVETQPTSGKVGAFVKILGTDLTGATSVTFNGKAAKFKVVSASLITTRVPTGATTGYVEVKTPKGTLKSNVVFRVKP